MIGKGEIRGGPGAWPDIPGGIRPQEGMEASQSVSFAAPYDQLGRAVSGLAILAVGRSALRVALRKGISVSRHLGRETNNVHQRLIVGDGYGNI
jgi:hypothetical protein